MTSADVLDVAPPTLTAADAEEAARRLFGVEAAAEPLVSERDQNFRLTDASGAAWVLKVSNAAEDRGVVEMEVAAVERISQVDPALPVPPARPARDGASYLHERVVELAERLLATMPDGLDTVLFVNSGSEANDLAWRLATAFTGADAGICTAWSYHGVTSAIADFSASEWPDGERPDAAEAYAAPDTYRGLYAEAPDPASVGRGEIVDAVGRLAERGRRPAALFVDSTFTADGIFVPKPAVVAEIVAAARDAGALFIADEVQSGHGRTGEPWGFSRWGVAPDIVTLGKPMGNGHPIAAVITRSEIVDRFGARTTFFSTFGGNPVACAAALAVLDVLESEELLARATTVGDWLRNELRSLAERYPGIGDVRGRGLMTGVELVVDRGSREPDSDLAAHVKDAMAERGVLIGTTGRLKNVLKIRPPLSMTANEAGIIVSTLHTVLTGAGR